MQVRLYNHQAYTADIEKLARHIGGNRGGGTTDVECKTSTGSVTVRLQNADLWLIGYTDGATWYHMSDCVIAGGTALSFSGSYKDLGMDPTTDRGAQFDLSAATLEQVHNLIHAQDDNTKKKYLAHLVVAISESTRFKFLTPEIAKIVKDNSSFKLTDNCTTGSIGKFYDNIHDWNGLSKGGSGIVRVRAAH